MEIGLIIQIAIIGMLATMLALTIKAQLPQMALVIALAGSIVILFLVLPSLSSVIDLLQQLTSDISIDIKYISIILKIICIAYIAEFGAQICIDDGDTAIASKIELAGKVLIMLVSAPILLSLTDVLVNMLP